MFVHFLLFGRFCVPLIDGTSVERSKRTRLSVDERKSFDGAVGEFVEKGYWIPTTQEYAEDLCGLTANVLPVYTTGKK